MESESPETWAEIAAIIGGSGLTGTVQGLVKGFAPTLSPEIAGALAGGLMVYFGGRVHWVVRALGVGVLAGSLAPLISKAIPKIGGSSGGSSPEEGQTAVDVARARYGMG